MLSINHHERYGWYGFFDFYFKSGDGLYFGTAGWKGCMTDNKANGLYFKTREELVKAMISLADKEGVRKDNEC